MSASQTGGAVITIGAALQQAAQLNSDSPLLDAQLLLCRVLHCNRTYLYTWPEKPLTAEQSQQYLALLEQRARGVPVAHLLECQEFWSLPLKVSSATLIPRPDTERLVELALDLVLPLTARVLDLGTGTGAIALALASERPQWQIVAVDSQPQAVALAGENARSLGLASVVVAESDWFSAVTGQFDLIVSNPPYIAASDPHLSEGDVRFEPRTALVGGDDGLADLRHIIAVARAFLREGGYLLVEHGADQGAAVAGLFRENRYTEVVTHKDLGGRDRVTLGRIWGGRERSGD
ncbi:MAG: peptide chain release factor N(5)-glutamine methyltransferase [Porticoccaceae bacterium]|nr:peptide chain release factor N(5)-glutamine methyltransferase [Porticoccaceae bacterium]